MALELGTLLPQGVQVFLWEETQQIESALRAEYQQTVVPVQDYERLIVLELQLRSCQRQKSCGA